MKILIKNAKIVNENKILDGDVLIIDDIICEISEDICSSEVDKIVYADGRYLFPGIIDDQVHFRDPGLVYKADIESESRAGIAGGVTSFIDQPNTIPNVISQDILEKKYQLAYGRSYSNYAFMMGGTNDNLDEILKTNPRNVPGIKLFLGSSTGNMLVDNPKTLEDIFSKTKMLIAVHCEDENIIRENTKKYQEKYIEDIPVEYHPLIRSSEACYKSSSKAIELAKKTGARLHVFHVSTKDEISLFGNDIPLSEKKITAEVCIHHLTFTDKDYYAKGNLIKWNPAVKSEQDREALWQAVLDDSIDVIATDHAPHTLDEKQNPYIKCPSGAPMVQHSLVVMLENFHRKKISLEKIVEKMCHNPATIFRIEKRGFIRKNYKADLVLVDLDKKWKVSKENILYKCGWSPLEGEVFHSSVTHTFVNGHLCYEKGKFLGEPNGERLLFNY